MRIAVNTFIVVAVCLLGAAAATGIMVYQYQVVAQAQRDREHTQLAVRDFEHLQTIMSQWFVTIDLFFSNQQSYLSSGIHRQAEQMLAILEAIRAEDNSLNQANFDEITGNIAEVARIIGDSSIAGPKNQAEWQAALNRADLLTYDIVEAVSALGEEARIQAQTAEARLTIGQSQFNRFAWICAAVYLLSVGTAWVWANRQIVQPLVSLTRTAGTTVSDESDISFTLSSGPREVQALGARLQEFSLSIHRARQKAEEEHQKSARAKERINAIMNAVADGIVTVDAEGCIGMVNRAATDLFRSSYDDLDGSCIDEMINGLFDRDSDAATLNIVLGQVTEFTMRRQDGTMVPVEVSATQMEIDGGQRYTMVIHDISPRKENERRLRELNQRLLDASRHAGIAEVATSILHNVGNALNSVNTTVAVIGTRLRQSRLPGLDKGLELIDSPERIRALAEDPGKATMLVDYLRTLNVQLMDEQQAITTELKELDKHVRHIETIVRSQQSHATHSSVVEDLHLREVFEESISMNKGSLENAGIEVERVYDDIDSFTGERHKLTQILVNIVRNAKDAIVQATLETPKLVLRLSQDRDFLFASVTDNGVGIQPEVMEKLFSFGFTTKKDGHGFGLHSCALEAKNMGGALNVTSEGKGKGATFTLQLPRKVGGLRHANA